MAQDYGDKPHLVRRSLLESEALTAEWDVPGGRIGQIVRQLRRRGKIAARRAGAVFGLLVCVILLGLAYYLGQPLWQVFFDGSTQTLDRQRQAIADQFDGLNEGRDGIYSNDTPGQLGLVQLADRVLIRLAEASGVALNPPAFLDGSIYVTGTGETILRVDPETDTTFVIRTSDPGGESFNPPFVHDGQIYITGFNGSILRLTPGIDEPERLRDAGTEILNEPVAFDGNLYVTGRNGSLLRVNTGAAPGPNSVTTLRVATTLGEGLNRPIVFDGALYVTGRDGTFLRLDADAEAPVPLEVETFGDRFIRAPMVADGVLYATGSDGTIYQLMPGAEAPVAIREGFDDSEGFEGPVFFDGALFYAGSQGTVLRQSAHDRTPLPFSRSGPLPESLRQPAVFDGALFLTGQFGSILRLSEGATALEVVREPNGQLLFAPEIFSDALYIIGANGTLLRVASRDADPVSIVPPGLRGVIWPFELDGVTYFTGNDGNIRRTSEPEQQALTEISPRLPLSRPEELRERSPDEPIVIEDELLDAIDALIANADPVPPELVSLRRRLDIINAQLGALNITDAAVQRQRQKFDVGFWALVTRADPAISFSNFMSACGEFAGEPTPEIAEACISAYYTQEDQAAPPWWEILARQVPPGVLLLFLLLTLGGLYRYNMRLAGFHHSRADLLELASIGRDPEKPLTQEEWRDIRETAAALAADMVGFGTSKAGVGPQGVSFEFARRSDDS